MELKSAIWMDVCPLSAHTGVRKASSCTGVSFYLSLIQQKEPSVAFVLDGDKLRQSGLLRTDQLRGRCPPNPIWTEQFLPTRRLEGGWCVSGQQPREWFIWLGGNKCFILFIYLFLSLGRIFDNWVKNIAPETGGIFCLRSICRTADVNTFIQILLKHLHVAKINLKKKISDFFFLWYEPNGWASAPRPCTRQVTATVTAWNRYFSSQHIVNICLLCTEKKSNFIFYVIFSDGWKPIFKGNVWVHQGCSLNPSRGRLLTAARSMRLFCRREKERGSVAGRARAHVNTCL